MLSISLQRAQRLLSQKAALSLHRARAGLGQGHRSRCSALKMTWLAFFYRYQGCRVRVSQQYPLHMYVFRSLMACVSNYYYTLTHHTLSMKSDSGF